MKFPEYPFCGLAREVRNARNWPLATRRRQYRAITWVNEWIGPCPVRPCALLRQRRSFSISECSARTIVVKVGDVFGLAIGLGSGWAVWGRQIVQVSWPNARCAGPIASFA